MSPPDKYVGIVYYLLGKTALGVVKGSSSDLYVIALEKACDICVDTTGIKLGDTGNGFFVFVFVPNGYFHN
jgi:hypothetical protein